MIENDEHSSPPLASLFDQIIRVGRHGHNHVPIGPLIKFLFGLSRPEHDNSNKTGKHAKDKAANSQHDELEEREGWRLIVVLRRKAALG